MRKLLCDIFSNTFCTPITGKKKRKEKKKPLWMVLLILTTLFKWLKSIDQLRPLNIKLHNQHYWPIFLFFWLCVLAINKYIHVPVFYLLSYKASKLTSPKVLSKQSELLSLMNIFLPNGLCQTEAVQLFWLQNCMLENRPHTAPSAQTYPRYHDWEGCHSALQQN